MVDKKLIRRALMGDREAQKECTRRGIVLPCPFCGKELRERKTKKWTAAKDEPIIRTVVEHRAKTGYHLDNWVLVKELDLESWNTRTAPPVGRCGECALWKEEKECPGSFCCTITGMERESNDFCSEFEPREE